MTYVTYGDVRLRATAAGLVMARVAGRIRLRYRDPVISAREWTGLDVPGAFEVVKTVEAARALKRP